jgi:KDO2-lipid IV(A) lauroyltransferase
LLRIGNHFSCIARRDAIALLVDQKYNQGPEVEFFGQPVNASPGAARLALKFGTVMQPLSVVRLPGARFRVTAHEPITVRETEDKAAAVLAGIQAANRFVEDRVREVPEDWFWVHKRWPDRVYAALEAAAPSAERRNGPQ